MSALIDALLGAQKEDLQSNPWISGARGLAATDLNQYNMNPWTRALLQVGQGLGTGLMSGYGQRQVEAVAQDRANKIADLVTNNSTGKPLVDALKDIPGMSPYIGAIAVEDAASKAASRDAMNKILLEKQGIMLGSDNKPMQIFDPIAQEIRLAGGKKAAELAAENVARGPYALSPEKIANLEVDLSNKIASSPEARAFGDVDANFKALQGLATQKSQAASVGMITIVAKILDPGAVVQQSDFAVYADPGSPARGLQSYLSKVQGEGALRPEMKQELIQMAKEAVKARYGNYSNLADSLIFTGKAQGVNPNNIRLRSMPDLSFQLLEPAQQGDFSLEEIDRALARRQGPPLVPGPIPR